MPCSITIGECIKAGLIMISAISRMTSDHYPSEKGFDWAVGCFQALIIIFIVIGHLEKKVYAGPFGLFPLYSFHVAAFAFVSGYLYSKTAENDFTRYLASKVKRLILPMYLINMAYGFLIEVIHVMSDVQIGMNLSWGALLLLPWTSGHQFALNLPMWFIAPFFLAQIIWAGLRSTFCRVLSRGGRSRIVDSCSYGWHHCRSDWGKGGLAFGNRAAYRPLCISFVLDCDWLSMEKD